MEQIAESGREDEDSSRQGSMRDSKIVKNSVSHFEEISYDLIQPEEQNPDREYNPQNEELKIYDVIPEEENE